MAFVTGRTNSAQFFVSVLPVTRTTVMNDSCDIFVRCAIEFATAMFSLRFQFEFRAKEPLSISFDFLGRFCKLILEWIKILIFDRRLNNFNKKQTFPAWKSATEVLNSEILQIYSPKSDRIRFRNKRSKKSFYIMFYSHFKYYFII